MVKGVAVTGSELARIAGVSHQSIRLWALAGKIPSRIVCEGDRVRAIYYEWTPAMRAALEKQRPGCTAGIV